MAIAKGVDESFRSGVDLGAKYVTSRLDNKSRIKQAEKERLDGLVKAYPTIFNTDSYNRALDEIEKTGSFRLPLNNLHDLSKGLTAGVETPTQNEGIIPLTSPQQVAPISNGLQFQKAEKKVFVDPVLAAVYPELAPYNGQEITQSEFSEIAKASRAKTYANNQLGRQDDSQNAAKEMLDKKNKIDIEDKKQSSLNSDFKIAYTAYLKAKTPEERDALREFVADAAEAAGKPQDMVEKFRTKTMTPQEENSWFSKMFGVVKEKVKTAFNQDLGESQTRRMNPKTKKWWVFKGGQWQPE